MEVELLPLLRTVWPGDEESFVIVLAQRHAAKVLPPRDFVFVVDPIGSVWMAW